MRPPTPRGLLNKQNRLRKLFGGLSQADIDEITRTVQLKQNPKKFMPKLPPVVRPHRTAYGYLRVSHLDSAVSGLGLEAQKQQIESYFKYIKTMPGNENLHWGGFYVDPAVSAYRNPLITRPAGKEMQSVLEPGDVVIFSKLDRGFRDARDFMNTSEYWRQNGIVFHFMDIQVDSSTAMGRLMCGMLALMAEWESARKSERTKEAFAIARAQGRQSSEKAPIGFLYIGQKGRRKIAVNWDGRVIGRYIRLLKRIHGMTLRDISKRIRDLMSNSDVRAARFCAKKNGVRATTWCYQACLEWLRATETGIPAMEKVLEERRAKRREEEEALAGAEATDVS